MTPFFTARKYFEDEFVLTKCPKNVPTRTKEYKRDISRVRAAKFHKEKPLKKKLQRPSQLSKEKLFSLAIRKQ